MIERFLPQQLSDDQASAEIQQIIADTGASSMKDMGRVMAEVKARLGTRSSRARPARWSRLPWLKAQKGPAAPRRSPSECYGGYLLAAHLRSHLPS